MAKAVVAGTIRVPPENLAALKAHMVAYIQACRAEDGCEIFSFAEDVAEPGLIRIFEVWRGTAELERHKTAPHVGVWRSLWPQHGVHDRSLTRYDVSDTETF